MKEILRQDYDSKEICRFICVGIWQNGYKAYSKITKDEKGKDIITEYDDSTYYQVRHENKLVMRHV